MHQATQCNSQEAATPRAEMSAVLVIYTGILTTQGKENGTRTLFATNCAATKRALTSPRDSYETLSGREYGHYTFSPRRRESRAARSRLRDGGCRPRRRRSRRGAAADPAPPAAPGAPAGAEEARPQPGAQVASPGTQLSRDFFATYLTYYKRKKKVLINKYQESPSIHLQ